MKLNELGSPMSENEIKLLELACTEIPDLEEGVLPLYLDVAMTPPFVDNGLGTNPRVVLPELNRVLRELRAEERPTDLINILTTTAIRVAEERDKLPSDQITNRGMTLSFVEERIAGLSEYLREDGCNLDLRKSY